MAKVKFGGNQFENVSSGAAIVNIEISDDKYAEILALQKLTSAIKELTGALR